MVWDKGSRARVGAGSQTFTLDTPNSGPEGQAGRAAYLEKRLCENLVLQLGSPHRQVS